jgi:hypothetical protein
MMWAMTLRRIRLRQCHSDIISSEYVSISYPLDAISQQIKDVDITGIDLRLGPTNICNSVTLRTHELGVPNLSGHGLISCSICFLQLRIQYSF